MFSNFSKPVRYGMYFGLGGAATVGADYALSRYRKRRYSAGRAAAAFAAGGSLDLAAGVAGERISNALKDIPNPFKIPRT